MWVYIVRRTIQSIFVFILVSIICFTIMHLAPGNPFEQWMLPPPEVRLWINQQIHSHGLDQPIMVQYLSWLWKMMHGDFGTTMLGSAPIGPMLLPLMKNSLLLMGTAWVLSLAIAVPWGIHNSLRANGISDTIATLISFVVFSIPSFWLGIEMQVVFAYQLFWFPPSNMHSIAVNEKSLLDLAWHMVMPVIVLMFGFLASYLKHFRNSFLEVLSADFIRTARAKGASETRVLYRHALRNALIPIITVMAMDMPQLVGGSAFVELVFNWPGMGKELFTSAMIREYNMMMAIVIVTAMVVVIANWVADILYALVDPRIRVITRSQ